VKQDAERYRRITLACGKFRFNDLDLGKSADFRALWIWGSATILQRHPGCPRSRRRVQCGVNELPLTLVLSWYEQKAVCVLLTLLSLGIKNIYLGPTLPAFVSSNVLKVLVDKWNVTPISTPEADLKKILG
jgi:hydroxylamine reductase